MKLIIIATAITIVTAPAAKETCEKICEPDKTGLTVQKMLCTDHETGRARKITLYKSYNGGKPVPAACTD